MRRSTKWAVGLTVAAALATGGAWYSTFYRPRSECDDAIAQRRFKDAAPLCSAAYERTGEGKFAAAAAMAYVGIAQYDQAWRLANEPAARDLVRARRVRGVVLDTRNEKGAAQRELQTALALALERGEASEAARAAHMLGGMKWRAGHYSEAYEDIELSARQAALAHDGPALALAELARGDVFRYLGDAQQADGYYRRALEAAAPWPTDHAYAALKVGTAYLDREELALARTHLEEALSLADESGNAQALNAARFRLAEVLAKARDAEGAQRQLDAIPPRMRRLAGVASSIAEVALLRNDAQGALRALDQIDRARVSDQDAWNISWMRGRAARAAGDDQGAIGAWTAAIEAVEVLIEDEPEHQAWVAARRRRPFDALFALYASRGEHARAWEVVARYARAEALSLSDPSGADPRKLLAEAEALKHRPAGVDSDRQPKPAADATRDDREILVVHEAEGRLWVGIRRAGAVRFVDAGPSERFDPLLRTLLGDAGEARAAAELGTALWNAAGLAPSTEPLFVVGTGRMRRLAFAALEVDGRHWVEHRPLAKLASLDAPSTGHARFDGAAVVAGDPRGDLKDARDEVRWVSRSLNASPALGSGATRDVVLGARRASVLHLATHATVALQGTALLLADGELTAREILEKRPSARVVVLASCASAVGRETSGADSLATAFLRAGSGAVVATLRTVPDAAAHQLIEAFYRHGGASDPVHALAAAQLEVARDQPVSVWSAFTVLVGSELSGRSAAKEVAGR